MEVLSISMCVLPLIQESFENIECTCAEQKLNIMKLLHIICIRQIGKNYIHCTQSHYLSIPQQSHHAPQTPNLNHLKFSDNYYYICNQYYNYDIIECPQEILLLIA